MPRQQRFHDPRADPVWLRWLLIGLTAAFLALFLLVPLAVVFTQAFAKGSQLYLAAIRDPMALAAVKLTLVVAAIVVPVNTLFGIAAAWWLAHFRFRGKGLVVTLLDLPFAVSPVIAGMVFVLLFGAQGLLGPWLAERDVKVLFSLPGIVLATLFVTAPFVARQLLPLLEARGSGEEEAALTLGASGWQLLRWITLPKMVWGLLYGVILTNARAMGEFGAVSVISGHIRGRTNTIPLHVEILYNEYQFAAAFAVASLLTLLALVTLLAQALLRRRLGGGSAH
ncbi:MAG: sulfate ABC transporter permease subunit CysW [Thermoanaerobaculia bacterium]